MPQELIKLIQALETFKAESTPKQPLPDKFTVDEFIEMMDDLFSNKKEDAPVEEHPAEAPKFIQRQDSYKVLSLDGTLTAMDIASTNLVQVTKDTIKLVWPHTTVDFTLEPGKGDTSIGLEEFLKLAEFVAQ